MNVIEETIEATLDANGQLRLTHQPRLPPGPVRVTIRVAAPVGPRRGMADVIQEIDADQRLRGFHGRSAAVGFFPVLPRAEPADAGPDCRDAPPGQRYPGWSHLPGNSARSAEAVRTGRRPPSRRRHRVRL